MRKYSAILQMQSPEFDRGVLSFPPQYRSFFMLPIVNKPVIGYVLDTLRSVNIVKILILLPREDMMLRAYLANQVGIDVQVIITSYEPDIDQLIKQYVGMPVGPGACLDYPISIAMSPIFPRLRVGLRTINAFNKKFIQSDIIRLEEFHPYVIDSPFNFVQLNDRLLFSQRSHVLPSYRTVDGILLGASVHLPHKAYIKGRSLFNYALNQLEHYRDVMIRNKSHGMQPPPSAESLSVDTTAEDDHRSPTASRPKSPAQSFDPNILHLEAPTAIGDFTMVDKYVTIRNCVIGNHCAIGRGCNLTQCIVLDNTVIAPGIRIARRIIAGSRIINPETGSYKDVPTWISHSL